MSFGSSVHKLMVDSGLNYILKHGFGGIDKMLSGKRFPQNVSALVCSLRIDYINGLIPQYWKV